MPTHPSHGQTTTRRRLLAAAVAGAALGAPHAQAAPPSPNQPTKARTMNTIFTEDLQKLEVPTPIIHGDDGQIVPIQGAALLSVRLVKGAALKISKGGSHSLGDTAKDQPNADLLAFART